MKTVSILFISIIMFVLVPTWVHMQSSYMPLPPSNMVRIPFGYTAESIRSNQVHDSDPQNKLLDEHREMEKSATRLDTKNSFNFGFLEQEPPMMGAHQHQSSPQESQRSQPWSDLYSSTNTGPYSSHFYLDKGSSKGVTEPHQATELLQENPLRVPLTGLTELHQPAPFYSAQWDQPKPAQYGLLFTEHQVERFPGQSSLSITYEKLKESLQETPESLFRGSQGSALYGIEGGQGYGIKQMPASDNQEEPGLNSRVEYPSTRLINVPIRQNKQQSGRSQQQVPFGEQQRWLEGINIKPTQNEGKQLTLHSGDLQGLPISAQLGYLQSRQFDVPLRLDQQRLSEPSSSFTGQDLLLGKLQESQSAVQTNHPFEGQESIQSHLQQVPYSFGKHGGPSLELQDGPRTQIPLFSGLRVQFNEQQLPSYLYKDGSQAPEFPAYDALRELPFQRKQVSNYSEQQNTSPFEFQNSLPLVTKSKEQGPFDGQQSTHYEEKQLPSFGFRGVPPTEQKIANQDANSFDGRRVTASGEENIPSFSYQGGYNAQESLKFGVKQFEQDWGMSDKVHQRPQIEQEFGSQRSSNRETHMNKQFISPWEDPQKTSVLQPNEIGYGYFQGDSPAAPIQQEIQFAPSLEQSFGQPQNSWIGQIQNSLLTRDNQGFQKEPMGVINQQPARSTDIPFNVRLTSIPDIRNRSFSQGREQAVGIHQMQRQLSSTGIEMGTQNNYLWPSRELNNRLQQSEPYGKQSPLSQRAGFQSLYDSSPFSVIKSNQNFPEEIRFSQTGARQLESNNDEIVLPKRNQEGQKSVPFQWPEEQIKRRMLPDPDQDHTFNDNQNQPFVRSPESDREVQQQSQTDQFSRPQYEQMIRSQWPGSDRAESNDNHLPSRTSMPIFQPSDLNDRQITLSRKFPEKIEQIDQLEHVHSQHGIQQIEPNKKPLQIDQQVPLTAPHTAVLAGERKLDDNETNRAPTFSQRALPNSKIRLEVFFESLCPDSRGFFQSQLKPMMDKIGDYVQLELHPFGKGHINQTGEIRCHHGPNECLGNAVDACAIERLSTSTEQTRFVECMFANNRIPLPVAGQYCSDMSRLDWTKDIDPCARGPEGSALSNKHAVATLELDPPLDWVPFIILNNNRGDEDYQKLLSQYLIKETCAELTKMKNRPQNC